MFGISKKGGLDYGARLSKRQQTPSQGSTRVVKLHSCTKAQRMPAGDSCQAGSPEHLSAYPAVVNAVMRPDLLQTISLAIIQKSYEYQVRQKSHQNTMVSSMVPMHCTMLPLIIFCTSASRCFLASILPTLATIRFSGLSSCSYTVSKNQM